MKNKAGALFLCLFGLPFSFVGLFALYMITSSVVEWQSAKSWIQTEAKINKIDLKTSRSNKGGSTSSVQGSFSYAFKEQNYTSEQITFWSMSDNIGNFHKSNYKKLKRKRKTTCYVNPENPQEAVIIRDLRVEMLGFFSLFLVIFGGFGFSASGFSLISIIKANKVIQTPSGDFLDSYSGKAVVLFFALPTAFFLPICAVTFMETVSQFRAGVTSTFFAFLPLLIAIISTTAFIYFGSRHLNFGSSIICISEGQGVLGGSLKGYLINSCSPQNGFDLIINCNRTSRNGKNSQTQSIYNHSINLTETQMTPQGRYRTDFTIPLPYDIPESNESNVTWNIKFKADVPGPDYSCSFDIPVHQTEESDPTQTKDLILKDSGVTETHPSIIKERILTHRTKERLHIYFPMFRKIWSIVSLIFFLTIWIGLTVFLYYKKAWVFAVIWGLTDLMLIISLLHLMFVSKKLIVANEGIVFKKGFFGGGKEYHIEAHEVEEIIVPPNNIYGMSYLKIKTPDMTIDIEKQFMTRETPAALKILIEDALYPEKGSIK
ncbi:MAG: DUF3592 domain-containing protein [Lentisphaerales bacterium]|nr:DUF3592 domain-containing protein [Lentisphaerales bacterium]